MARLVNAACAICGQPAKYACPRCSTRTCSAACSTSHKAATACSGERDRTAYVGRERYGYMNLMEDYRFLEDVSRRLGESTKAVDEARAALPRSAATKAASKAAKRAKGPMRDPAEGLRRTAATCEIDLVLLPSGMAKRESNKTRVVTSENGKSLEWTVTWSLRIPPTSGSPLLAPPISVTAHKNAATSTLPELFLRITMHGQLPKQAQPLVDRLRGSKTADQPATGFENAVFLMAVPARAVGPTRGALEVLDKIEARPAPTPAINTTHEPLPQYQQPRIGTLIPHHSLPARPGVAHLGAASVAQPAPAPAPPPAARPTLAPAKRYWLLAASQPLSAALRQTIIIEWPEIEVWERTMFDTALRLGYIEIAPRHYSPPVAIVPAKRTASNAPPQAPPNRGLAALQGYSDESGSDGEEGEVVEESRGGGHAMGSLVGYFTSS